MRTIFGSLVTRAAQSYLLRHASNYLLANIATKGLSIISLPVMTRLLSPADYGVVSIVTGYVVMLSPVLSLNLYTALGRYFFEQTDDFPEFFGTNTIITTLLLAAALVVTFLFSESLAGVLDVPANAVLFIVPLISVQLLTSYHEQVFQALEESRRVAVRQLVHAYTAFGLSVLFVVLLGTDRYLGRLIGTLCAGVLVGLLVVRDLRPHWSPVFRLRSLRYAVNFGLPLLPYSLSTTILSQFDRIVMNVTFGSAATGAFSYASNIGMLMSLFVGSLMAAWTPRFFRNMAADNHEAVNRTGMAIFLVVVGASFGLMLFGREIGLVLGARSFHADLGIVPVVVSGYVFSAVFSLFGMLIGHAKKTWVLSVVVLSAGVVNIILNARFVPEFGARGAAYTTVVSFALMAMLAWVFSHFLLRVRPYRLLHFALVIVYFLIATFGILITVNNASVSFISILLKFIIFLTLNITLLFFRNAFARAVPE